MWLSPPRWRTSAHRPFQTCRKGLSVSSQKVRSAKGAPACNKCADLRTFSWSYAQRGLVASVATEAPNRTAWQRFLPGGPLALLPARGGFSNIVWSTSAAHAAALQACTPEEFANAVNKVPARKARSCSCVLRSVPRCCASTPPAHWVAHAMVTGFLSVKMACQPV